MGYKSDMAQPSSHPGATDINEVFRGGGRSIEFLDRINMASIVMLEETGIVPHATARPIAQEIGRASCRERVL